MTRHQKIRDTFSHSLKQCLVARYTKVPSAAFVAKEFNLRTEDVDDSISQESARKWLRGLAVPELDKLLILQAWLQIDLNTLNISSVELQINEREALGNDTLSNNKLFLKKTASLKKELLIIMKNIADLEEVITRSKS